MTNFIDKCLRGEALLEEVDDYVDEWYDSDTQETLAEYLGMTDTEYDVWTMDASSLRYIVIAHREKKDIEDILDEANSEYSIAARSKNNEVEPQIITWLHSIGELD